MALLRCLALGLLAGAALALSLTIQRGSGLDHLRLSYLMGLVFAQVVTVPLGLLIGGVLAARRVWTHTRGYLLSAVTLVFGLLVAMQAEMAQDWLNGRPSGVGDPDGEYVMAALAQLSGVFTVIVGVGLALTRWARPTASAAQAKATARPAQGGSG